MYLPVPFCLIFFLLILCPLSISTFWRSCLAVPILPFPHPLGMSQFVSTSFPVFLHTAPFHTSIRWKFLLPQFAVSTLAPSNTGATPPMRNSHILPCSTEPKKWLQAVGRLLGALRGKRGWGAMWAAMTFLWMSDHLAGRGQTYHFVDLKLIHIPSQGPSRYCDLLL